MPFCFLTVLSKHFSILVREETFVRKKFQKLFSSHFTKVYFGFSHEFFKRVIYSSLFIRIKVELLDFKRLIKLPVFTRTVIQQFSSGGGYIEDIFQ